MNKANLFTVYPIPIARIPRLPCNNHLLCSWIVNREILAFCWHKYGVKKNLWPIKLLRSKIRLNFMSQMYQLELVNFVYRMRNYTRYLKENYIKNTRIPLGAFPLPSHLLHDWTRNCISLAVSCHTNWFIALVELYLTLTSCPLEGNGKSSTTNCPLISTGTCLRVSHIGLTISLILSSLAAYKNWFRLKLLKTQGCLKVVYNLLL